jgi:hypothetical protein
VLAALWTGSEQAAEDDTLSPAGCGALTSANGAGTGARRTVGSGGMSELRSGA